MQRMYGVDLKVTCSTRKVLETLYNNRKAHAAIVKEANAGYLEKAEAIMTKGLADLKKGKVIPLSFHLTMPINHLSAYDTIITMLELHNGTEITLSANEVSQFVEDKWEWSNQFLGTNAIYSASAAQMQPLDE